jgi:hypothetical protein
MVRDPQSTPFPYEERVASVAAAQRAVDRTFRAVTRRNDREHPATVAWLAAVDRLRAAIDAAYPPGFWRDYDRLRERNPAGLESAIEFLEADPWFFRSGYVKAKLIRLINRFSLTPEQADRLRSVVLNIVDRRGGQEFRAYCRLARHVDGADLRPRLQDRLVHADSGVRRRAGWVLAALGPDKP